MKIFFHQFLLGPDRPRVMFLFILFLLVQERPTFHTNPRPLLFQLKNVMVVGIDTYHDSAKKGRSVGGVICSTNNLLTRYYSRTTFQHTGEELVNGIVTSMRGQSPSTVFLMFNGAIIIDWILFLMYVNSLKQQSENIWLNKPPLPSPPKNKK